MWLNPEDKYYYHDNGFRLIRREQNLYQDVNGFEYYYYNDEFRHLHSSLKYSKYGLRNDGPYSVVDVYGNLYFRRVQDPETVIFSGQWLSDTLFQYKNPVRGVDYINCKRQISRRSFVGLAGVFIGTNKLWTNLQGFLQGSNVNLQVVSGHQIREISHPKFGPNERRLKVLGYKRIIFGNYDRSSVICGALDENTKGCLIEAVNLHTSDREFGICELMGLLKAFLQCDGLIYELARLDSKAPLNKNNLTQLKQLSQFQIRDKIKANINLIELSLQDSTEPENWPLKAPQIRDELIDQLKLAQNLDNYSIKAREIASTFIKYRDSLKFIDLCLLVSPFYTTQVPENLPAAKVRKLLNQAIKLDKQGYKSWNKSLSRLIEEDPSMTYLSMLQVEYAHIVAVNQASLTRARQENLEGVDRNLIDTAENRVYLLSILHKIFEHADLMQVGQKSFNDFVFCHKEIKEPYVWTLSGHAVVEYYAKSKLILPLSSFASKSLADSLIAVDAEKQNKASKVSQTQDRTSQESGSTEPVYKNFNPNDPNNFIEELYWEFCCDPEAFMNRIRVNYLRKQEKQHRKKFSEPPEFDYL